MTDIRELLLEATSDVRVDETNPTARVRQATNRHQLRLVAATTAAVVAIVGAGVALDKTTTSKHQLPSASKQIESWVRTSDSLVATGLGSAWTVNVNSGNKVVQRDAHTGAVIGSYQVAPQVQHLATGVGRIWAYGANQLHGAGVINVINPTSGAVLTVRAPANNALPHAIAFADGAAWITFPLLHQVWILQPAEDSVVKHVVHVPGTPLQIATTGGQVWVEHSGKLTHLLPVLAPGREKGPVLITGATLDTATNWRGAAFSSTTKGQLWSGIQGSLLKVDLRGDPCGTECGVITGSIATDGPPVAVVETTLGLFVSSTVTGPTPHGATEFIPRSRLEQQHPHPTAEIPSYGLLAADGSGVLIATADHGITRWTPRP